METQHKVVIVDRGNVILTKVVKPGLTQLTLNEIIYEHQQQAKQRTQLHTEYATKKAEQLTQTLSGLPFHRKLACVTKYVIAPLLKPPHGLV